MARTCSAIDGGRALAHKTGCRFKSRDQCSLISSQSFPCRSSRGKKHNSVKGCLLFRHWYERMGKRRCWRLQALRCDLAGCTGSLPGHVNYCRPNHFRLWIEPMRAISRLRFARLNQTSARSTHLPSGGTRMRPRGAEAVGQNVCGHCLVFLSDIGLNQWGFSLSIQRHPCRCVYSICRGPEATQRQE